MPYGKHLVDVALFEREEPRVSCVECDDDYTSPVLWQAKLERVCKDDLALIAFLAPLCLEKIEVAALTFDIVDSLHVIEEDDVGPVFLHEICQGPERLQSRQVSSAFKLVVCQFAGTMLAGKFFIREISA